MRITKVRNIIVNAINALDDSVIISEFEEGAADRTLKVAINGSHSSAVYLYCNDTDICKINCQSSGACGKLILSCNGTCYVNCDESNGIECPIVGVYSIWTTVEPTVIPTAIPTVLPTGIPTGIPTGLPSLMPTAMPTTQPTADRDTTSIPSHQPSGVPTVTTDSFTSTVGSTESTSKVHSSTQNIMSTTISTSDTMTTDGKIDTTPSNAPKSSNKGTITIDKSMFIVIIAGVSCLVAFVILLLLFYCMRNNKILNEMKKQNNKKMVAFGSGKSDKSGQVAPKSPRSVDKLMNTEIQIVDFA